MARVRVKRPAPLVNVPIIFSREELHGLDFMARAMHLDRASVVRRALDVLVAVGPQEVSSCPVPVGALLADVCCAACGGSEW